MDAREKEILDMQKAGMSRNDISSKYYNGIDKKNNLKCLNKYMQRRGYEIINGKYVKQNTLGIQINNAPVLAKGSIEISNEYTKKQKEENVLQKEYEDRLKTLEQKYEELEAILHACSQVSVTTVSNDTEFKIDLPESNYVKMSSWINEDVWNQWKAFTDKHEQYGKKYLVSQALLNFLEQNS